MITYLINLWLWATWSWRSKNSVPTFPTGATPPFTGWKPGLWWGDRLKEGIQIFSSPDMEKGVFRCAPIIPPEDGQYHYHADNMHSTWFVRPPFKAEVHVTYVGRMHPKSWDAPLWFYGDDPNEIDVVEIWGDKFAPNIHWGKSKKEKKTLSPMKYKLPGSASLSFSVDVELFTKFYCNGKLVRIAVTPDKFFSQHFRAIVGVGSASKEPIEPRNTMMLESIYMRENLWL